MVWVSGRLHLANGDKLDAVFQVHSVGAELHAVYVSVAGTWHLLEEERVPELLGSDRGKIFPYDYEFALSFEPDNYH